MGDFAIKIEAVGGHNGTSGICDPPHTGEHSCVDCKALELVDWMKARGYQMKTASFHHWPASAPNGDHIDDLLSKMRVK